MLAQGQTCCPVVSGITVPPATRPQSRFARAAARLMPVGVRGRLFMLITLVLLPLALLLGWVHYKHYALQYRLALQTELEVADGVATTFAAYLDDARRENHAIGRSLAIFTPGGDYARATRLLRAVAVQHRAVRNLSWVGSDGVVLASTHTALVGRDLSERTYFRRIAAGDAWTIGDLTPSGNMVKTPTFVVASALRDEGGDLQGVVLASVDPTRLGEVTLTQRRPADGTYALFDRNGALVYRSDGNAYAWDERTRWQESDDLLRSARETGWKQVGFTGVHPSTERWVAARVPIGDTGWVAGASRPEAIALGSLRRDLWRDAAFAALVATLAFGLAYLVARTISGPLRRLEADARAIGRGGEIFGCGPLDPVEVRRLRYSVLATAADLIRRTDAVRESDARFRQLADAMPQLVWTADPDGRVDYYNGRYHEYKGIRNGTGAGFEWAPVLHKEDVERTVAAWQEAVATGRPYQMEHRVRRADGSIRWHLSRGVPMRDAEGRIVKWFGTATDIHDLKTAEEALRRERAQLQAVLDNSPVLISIMDLDGTVLLANKAIFDTVDVPPPERLIGHSVFESFPREVADALWANDLAALKSGGPVRVEETMHHRDGSRHTYLTVKFPVSYLDTGEPFGVCAIATDITESKRAQEALGAKSEQLARANAEMEEFAYAASHDLKAPLRAVANLALVIEEDGQALDPENRERLHLLRSRVTMMHRLIEGLLDYARFGQKEAARELVPLSPLVQDLGEELDLPPAFRLVVDDMLPTVCGDPSHLRQVFQNLIGNAVDHHDRDHGHVWVRGRDDGNGWCVEVADDGPGVPPEERERIFRMFSSGKSGNTGIGLAVVRKLVTNHGGRIEVGENRPRGAVFRISWPKP